jgi:hypothetical protein
MRAVGCCLVNDLKGYEGTVEVLQELDVRLRVGTYIKGLS